MVDEWIRGGVRHAVCCPGSRSTPLAVAVARAADEGRLSLYVRLDERSAAFFALGLAVRSQVPALLVTTSGTAAAELHPAVVEAGAAGAAMIVCTADRPPELHHVGAPQTVDQDHLFGRAVRWYAAPGVPRTGTERSWRPLACRALAESTAGPRGPGPVHLNLAFGEPLWEEPLPLPPGRRGGAPWHRSQRCSSDAPGAVVEMLARPGVRGLLVAGSGTGEPAAVTALSEVLHWPLLADPRSGVPAHPNLVTAADALLRGEDDTAAPEVVVRFGRPPASRVVGEWLERSGAEQVLVDPSWDWAEPSRSFSLQVPCDPEALCRAVAQRALTATPSEDWATGGDRGEPEDEGGPVADRVPPSEWLWSWQRAEAGAQRAIEGILATHPASEPAIVRALWQALDPVDALVVASSLPIRHLEWFGGSRLQPPPVVANRGANGIDGTISTALGIAAASAAAGSPGRVWAVVGDLAFFHDAGALLGSRRAGAAGGAGAASLDLVVLDNAGGGIFSLLPQAAQLPSNQFEALFGTPQDADVRAVAAAYGAQVRELGGSGDVVDAVQVSLGSGPQGPPGGVRVWRARTDREQTAELLALLWRSVPKVGR